MTSQRARVLIAGIGNIFLADDGFGVEVVHRLAHVQLPEHVRLMDVGVRSLHLAYELLEHQYDLAIFVDVVTRGGAPGTVYVIEPDNDRYANNLIDPHAVRPHQVIANLRALGGDIGRVVVVGCEPECLDEFMGLSEPVGAALGEAERLVLELANEPAGSAKFITR